MSEQVPEGGTPPPQDAPPQQPQMSMEDFDRRLAQRDQALMNNVSQMLSSGLAEVFSRMQPQQQAPANAQQQPITDEDFQARPVDTMNRFLEQKLAPLRQQGPHQPTPAEAAGILSMIELNKSKVRAQVGEDEWGRYGRLFEQSLQQANPHQMLDPVQMLAGWDTVKGFADRAFAARARQEAAQSGQYTPQDAAARMDRNANAQLARGTQPRQASAAPVELDDEQKRVLDAMGLAPETYRDYGESKTFDMGSRRRPRQ